jgi:UDP-N-acetylmuramyl pentapeptide phosphotransferase/UDP-N-acetylglucosamine-1-phosphate transferase
MFINIFILLAIFFVFNYVIFNKYQTIAYILNLFDRPNKKIKINIGIGYPVGGVIFFFNILVLFILEFFLQLGIFMIDGNELLLFFFCFLLLFLIGFLDDNFNLSPYTKLLLLFIIFYFFLVFDSSIQITELRFATLPKILNLDLFSKFTTVFFLLLFLNAFNMFDGINLQSGLYSIITISFFIFFIEKINVFFFILLFLFFFIYYNYNFNLFLGNTGSLLLAYIISYYFIKLYNMGSIKFAEEIYIYMCLPGLDMFRLFLIRIIKKKNPFKKDLSHIHHIIIRRSNFFNTIFSIQFCIIFNLLIAYFISLKFAIFFSFFSYFYLIFIYGKK